MSQLYSGQLKAAVTTSGYTLSIVGFDEPLAIGVRGPLAVINDKTYKLIEVSFGKDDEALNSTLVAVNGEPNMHTVFGKRPGERVQEASVAPFSEVTLEQLIAAGLLVPVN